MAYNHKQSLKEVTRHVLLKSGMIQILHAARARRGQNTAHLKARDMGEVFSAIYRDGVWVHETGQDSASGLGSTAKATQILVADLSAFLRETDCKTLVDIGCGDFNWMRHVEGYETYVGVDVVSSVIEQNTAQHGTPNRRFLCLDGSRAALPPGDAAICREVIFHLSFKDGLQMLRNIRAAGYRHVILTSDSSIWFNSDIETGDFRTINLEIAPYRLPAPKRRIRDGEVAGQRFLGVWNNAELPA